MPEIQRVPWVSIEEWKDVKQKFCSSNPQDWVRAYQLMLMWKLRCPMLPANVECSLGIVHVLIQKSVAETTSTSIGQVLFSNENDLQFSFSTAIVRFVNHIMIPSKGSFYTAASEQNIPDWVVNLRHDVSHSSALPPLALLESAVELAKKWLTDNYWDPQELEMTPVDGKTLGGVKTQVVSPLVEKVFESGLSCWLICQKRFKADKQTTICNLNSAESRELINLKKLLGSGGLPKGVESFSKLLDTKQQKGKKIYVRRLIKCLNGLLSAMVKKKNLLPTVVQSIFNTGILRSGGKDIKIWGPILKILHEIDSMGLFIEKLFEKLAIGTEGERKSATNWLLVLLPSLERVQRRWSNYRLGNKSDTFLNEKDYLNLAIRKAPRLSYEIFRKALINLDPISGSSDVASRYARFIRPKIGKESRSSIINLVNLYANDSSLDTEDIDLENLSMYSVDNLTTETFHRPEKEQTVPASDVDSIWTLVDIDVEEWHKCPIGLLPHQKEPNLKLPDLTWVEVPPQPRKRKGTEDFFEWDE